MEGRRPTINDVALRAGISKGMVSLALRGAPGPSAETAARVARVAEELGYRADRAASSLAARRTRLLGVTVTMRNSFHAELVEGVQAAAEEAGYEVVLAAVTRTRDEDAAVETLLDSRCEALLLLGPEVPARRLLALDRRTPVVVLGRRTRRDARGRQQLDVVRTADDLGIRLAVDHLVGLGHRDLLHVSAGAGDIAQDRRDGFERAVAGHGLAGRARVEPGAFHEDAGAAAARRMLEQGWPTTGVVAASDRIALGLLDVLAREGVDVPGRVSVVGYDDSVLAQLAHVQLTSVGQDPAEQARCAVRAAVERLDAGRTRRAEVVLDPHLVVRRTTAPPPGAAAPDRSTLS